MSRQPLLIVGASGRAAAASTLRAGFDPFVLDLFADADTERLCPARKLPMSEYPHGFVELAKQVPPMPWMYTGGLENDPEVVAAISATRELWGNGPEVLKRVRDPFWLSALLDRSNFAYPSVLPGDVCPLPEGRWMRKPLRGSAGLGISFARPDVKPSGDHFYQRFVGGEPMSVVCGGTFFIGVTRQLIGTDWLHAPPFRYAGNIRPIPNDDLEFMDIIHRSCVIGREANVRGVYGVDFIYDCYPGQIIEVNPRYPASAEVIELATGCSVIDRHRREFDQCNSESSGIKPMEKVVGKAIYYAPHAVTFPASGPWDESLAHCTDVWRRPDFADIPHAGDSIEAGHPVCTIFAESATEDDCVAKLKARAAELDRLFS